MKKRAAGIAVVSALLCGLVAWQAPDEAPPETGSAPDTAIAAELEPTVERVVFQAEQPVGTVRTGELKDTFMPASDYDSIFPYAAAIVGWKQDGTPVYRYALADAAGELITNPVYTSVERKACGDGFVWLLHDTKDGTARTACAAQDGSWAIGPFVGDVTVEDAYIFVKRTDSDVTLVYSSSGKVIGQINGEIVSCTDGVLVSRRAGETETTWYLSSGETAKQITSFSALSVSAFSGGSASVQFSDTEWGLVDAEGTVTDTDAVWLDAVYDGYVLAQDSAGLYGVLDTSGDIAIPFSYIRGVHCGENHPLYQLWEDDETCEVISAAKGQKLALPKDLNAQQLTVLPNDYFAYTDEDGDTVIFDDLKQVALDGQATFYRQGEFLIAVEQDGYQIFSMEDTKAGALISAYQYVAPEQEAAAADDVFTVVDPDTGLQGIGSTKGRLVLRAEYDSIYSVDGTYFAAVRDGWSGIVDSSGNWVVCTQLAGVSEGGADDEME